MQYVLVPLATVCVVMSMLLLLISKVQPEQWAIYDTADDTIQETFDTAGACTEVLMVIEYNDEYYCARVE